ncbi:MAG: hypothetical protein ACRENO_06310 [Thermodesulfobacteriota bacterium]
MKNNIDSIIEKAINIGINASSRIKFTDVKNASKYFHEIIHNEIMRKLSYRVSPKKFAKLADYLTEIAILGYTLHKVGIYDELSLEEFTRVIKKNKPINIIVFELENSLKKDSVFYTGNNITLNAA